MFRPIFVSPPRTIKKFIYNCGNSFVLEPIEELHVESKEKYGLMELCGENCSIYLSSEFGETILVDQKSTKLQRRQGRGGSSQNRIARLREETIYSYLKSSAEKAVAAYVRDGRTLIKGLLIVGPSLKKEQIIDYLEDIKAPIEIKAKEEGDPSYPLLIDFIARHGNDEESKEFELINDLLIRTPDLLAFGAELENEKGNIKKVYSSELIKRRFGGPVGIKYFAYDNSGSAESE